MKRTVLTIIALIFGIWLCLGQNVQTQKDIELKYQNAIESAQKNFNQKNYAQAKQDYQNAIKIKPENADFINEIIDEIDKLIPFGTNQNVVKQSTYTGIIVPGATLTEKLKWLQRSAESHNTYVLEINANENIAPTTLEYKGAINITLVLKGDYTNRTIRLSSNGTMFTINTNVTFILDNNITLQGHSQNTGGSMVVVNGGILKMNAGATITGNNDNGSSNVGAGVYLRSGTFEMSGGTISENSTSEGGGVYVSNGTFTMNGGTISGNTAKRSGGGVHTKNGAFTMNGGTISGNTAQGEGGGVYGYSVAMNDGIISGNKATKGGGISGNLTMRGGTITGNTATEYGGGVYGRIDTKTGGTITGYSSDSKNGNVVNDGSGVLARRGHAIYYSTWSIIQRKETTAGPGTVNWDE